MPHDNSRSKLFKSLSSAVYDTNIDIYERIISRIDDNLASEIYEAIKDIDDPSQLRAVMSNLEESLIANRDSAISKDFSGGAPAPSSQIRAIGDIGDATIQYLGATPTFPDDSPFNGLDIEKFAPYMKAAREIKQFESSAEHYVHDPKNSDTQSPPIYENTINNSKGNYLANNSSVNKTSSGDITDLLLNNTGPRKNNNQGNLPSTIIELKQVNKKPVNNSNDNGRH